MKRSMLVGAIGAGKSSLIRALSGEEFVPRRAMAVEHHGDFVLTPGEFLENRYFYPALITTAANCECVLLVQDASARSSLFPPGLAGAFNRKIIGVISKAELPEANPERAVRFLRAAGAKDLIAVSVVTGEGIEELRGLLG